MRLAYFPLSVLLLLLKPFSQQLCPFTCIITGKSLTQSMINFNFAHKKDENILIEVTYADLRGTMKQIRGSFIR